MMFTCKEMILSLTAVVLVFTASTEGSCVSSITEFERIVIHENVENRAVIHRSFYGVNKPFPLSVQVIYHVNSSNGTDTIILTDPSCPPGKEIWLWVPSPVFIFIEPTKLNEYALRTMNYFTKWNPPKAHIHVPEICDNGNTRFNILNEMTSRIQVHSFRKHSVEQGYVLRGCGEDAARTLLSPTMQNNNRDLAHFAVGLVTVYILGTYFQTALVLLMSALLLHFKGNKIAEHTAQPSYDHYGLFWGYVVTSLAGNVVLIVHGIILIRQNLLSGVLELQLVAYAHVIHMVGGLLLALLIAVHFGRKLKFSIPSIFLWCFAIPCCNRKGLVKKTVQILSLWTVLYFQAKVMVFADFAFFAFLARAHTVVATLLLLLFAAFCTIHFLAIIFKSTAVKRSSKLKYTVLPILINIGHTMVFTITFAAAFCFGLVICAAGALANYRTQDNSPYPALSIIVTPIVLAVTGWALRQVGSQWLKLHMSLSARKAPHEEQSCSYELPSITDQGDDVASASEHVQIPYISWLRGKFGCQQTGPVYEPIAN